MADPKIKKLYALQESPFYRLQSRRKLAELLFISYPNLQQISKRTILHSQKWKHKKLPGKHPLGWRKYAPPLHLDDQYREINEPEPIVKKMQSRIASLLGRVKQPDFLFSPVKGRSYVDNARFHKHQKSFRFLDVKDYFPSCTANNVARFFRRELECSKDVTAIITHLCCHNSILAQGPPSSPILAFLANKHVWLEVDRLITSYACKWTLYADDLTISGRVVPKRLIWSIKELMRANRLTLKSAKEGSASDCSVRITGTFLSGGKTHLPNGKVKLINDIRREFQTIRNLERRQIISRKLAGHLAQKRQVEQNNGGNFRPKSPWLDRL